MALSKNHQAASWKVLRCALPLLVLVALLPQPSSAGQGVLKRTRLKLLTVMGDSNSDSGNASFAAYSFFKQKPGLPDPAFYFAGRYSNGPVWTDFVNKCLPVSSYAVAFGTVCDANGFRQLLDPTFPDLPVISVEDQVDAYVGVPQLGLKGPHKRAVLLWGGPNDFAATFFQDPDGPTGPLPSYLDTHTDEVINGVIDCTITSIKKLYNNGDRHFIVMNMQPLHLSVILRTLDAAAPGIAARLMSYIITYNERLVCRLASLALSGASVDLLDIYNPLRKLLTGQTPVPGVTDITTLCLPIESAFDLLKNPLVLSNGQPPVVCSNPNEHVNWDLTHLTTVAHEKVIAATVIDFLKSKDYITNCWNR